MSGPYRLNRTLIEVSGPDARDFLNNLLTQNLDRLDGAQLAYGALLTPQGKILADMLIWRTDEGVVLEADPEHADELERRLGMYRLRAQAKIERSARQGVLWSPHPFDGAHADPRLADLGYRRLGAPSEAPSGDSAYDALRLALGAPHLARDAAPEEVFALEALLEELNGVDFKKGCFIGQEVVSRMQHRGTARRRPVTVRGGALAAGTPITTRDVPIGMVGSAHGDLGVAIVRLDRAQDARDAGVPLMAAGAPVELGIPAWAGFDWPKSGGDGE